MEKNYNANLLKTNFTVTSCRRGVKFSQAGKCKKSKVFLPTFCQRNKKYLICSESYSHQKQNKIIKKKSMKILWFIFSCRDNNRAILVFATCGLPSTFGVLGGVVFHFGGFPNRTRCFYVCLIIYQNAARGFMQYRVSQIGWD